jgi:hypothetical protein
MVIVPVAPLGGVYSVVLLFTSRNDPVPLGVTDHIPGPLASAITSTGISIQVLTSATVATAAGLTLTITPSVAVQPLSSVTVTLYVVLELGLAAGLNITELFKLPTGLQLYVRTPEPPLPIAFRFVFDVLHIV